ncbi:hypothetical protein [Streptomyces tendae]
MPAESRPAAGVLRWSLRERPTDALELLELLELLCVADDGRVSQVKW